MLNSAEPYPVRSTGPLVEAAVIQHSNNTGVDPALAAVAAMSCVTAGVQALFDVQRPGLKPSSVSSLSIVCAGSGAGKSTAAKVFLEPHEQVQKSVGAAPEDRDQSKVKRQVWEEKHSLLRAEISQLIKNEAATEAAEKKLVEHLREEPLPPPRLLHDRVTPRALAQNLERFPSTLIASLDAGHVLNSKVTTEFDLMNGLWDGEPVRVDTLRGQAHAAEPRAGALLYVQPGVTLRFLQRHMEAAKDTGYFARVDWTYMPDCQIQDTPPRWRKFQAVEAFQGQLKSMLEEGVRAVEAGRARKAIQFTAHAAHHFSDLFSRTRKMGMPGGELHELGGYAAKIAERVARYACVIHVFNGLPGDIKTETLWDAEAIVQWHTRQFLAAHTAASPRTQAQHDAQQLEHNLLAATQRGDWLRLSDLQRWSPEDWSRSRCTRALRVLEEAKRVYILTWKHNTKFIQLAFVPQALGYGARAG